MILNLEDGLEWIRMMNLQVDMWGWGITPLIILIQMEEAFFLQAACVSLSKGRKWYLPYTKGIRAMWYLQHKKGYKPFVTLYQRQFDFSF
ncbi:hypothetical protein LZZ85_24380 [Terrimonas sp. NA20]|uniref:Uncharacterized protein n=1 Tax=Terrimonas ginsenosidimutans TaxID=2908004 RepID=A0ABS9KYV2_9BACT|nr:hypothetical protein [Terrimonas ginsenosidimutans]MCG2617458.1 hypothetical protein [Terrimonas ginsenosidimutans]